MASRSLADFIYTSQSRCAAWGVKYSLSGTAFNTCRWSGGLPAFCPWARRRVESICPSQNVG